MLDSVLDVGESERFDYVCKKIRRLRREIFKVALKINGLSLDNCRRILKLFSEGKNYHEIAEIFNIR